jgi:hypothetical protein
LLDHIIRVSEEYSFLHPLQSKYFPQHHVVKHQAVYVRILMLEKKFHTHIKPQTKLTFVHSDFHVQ